MNIVVADCYHDSDKGGGGIIGGTLEAIYNVCRRHNCDPQISLLYRFSADDPRFASASRLTSKVFPQAKILPAPISSQHGPGLKWIFWFFKVFLVGPIRLLFPGLSGHVSVKALRKADIVIFKGGHFYRSWTKNPVLDTVALYLLTYTLLMCRRLKCRFCVLSHSFGPFHSNWSRRIISFALERAEYLSCRESISKDNLTACGMKNEKIHVDCDLGFAVTSTGQKQTEDILKSHGLKPFEYVAVTARPWFQSQRKQGIEEAYNKYIKNMAEMCDYVIEHRHKKITLVLQNDGAHSVNEPDIFPLRDIRQNIRNKNEAIIMDNDFTFEELVAIYANAELTIGTRLHSCIFSFAVGTPSIAVGYAHKAEGIMKMMDAENFVLRIENLSASDGKRMIDEITSNRNELSAKYINRVKELKDNLFISMERSLFGSDKRGNNPEADK